MAEHQLGAILSLAFGLGLFHALDADHIMAVSGLASKRPNFKQSLMFCLRWAIGHGSALLVIGIAVFVVGAAIPEQLSQIAEQSVGIILLVLGIWIIIDFRQRKVRLLSHQHHGLPRHTHWHDARSEHHLQHSSASKNQHANHSAVLVGVLHGIAGSAPLLAIIPLTTLNSTCMALPI